MEPSDEAGSRKPSLDELTVTVAAASLFALALLVPAVGRVVQEIGFFLLEIVSILIDRPTTLVVTGYVACTGLALLIDLRQPSKGRLRAIGWIAALLALLGGFYLLSLAALLRPGLLAACLGLGGLGWVAGRRLPASDTPPTMAPVVTLLVVIHLLVEGTAGHILTPYLHSVNAALARFSAFTPLLYDAVLGLVLMGTAMLFAPRSQVKRFGAMGGGIAVVGAALPGSVPWAALLGASLLLGAAVASRGERYVTWLYLEPLKLLRSVAPVMITGLLVVTAHYGAAIWRCDGLEIEGGVLTRLSAMDGTFDLEPTSQGDHLVVSRREPQEVVVLRLSDGEVLHRMSTRSENDTWFDHTEPETLVHAGGSSVLLLLASSDSEEGNQLVRFDAATGTMSGRLIGLGEGVSDMRRDQQGGVWISTEFRGRIAKVDPRTLTVLSDKEVRDAETNAIAVDVKGGRGWSVGLWSDAYIRRVDLETGQQKAAAYLGTRQWDLAWDPISDRIYVPRLVDGVVEVRDANSLAQVGAWEVGFGARPIEVSKDGRFLVVGNLYTGELLGWDLTTAKRTLRARIGGHIKGLRLDASGRVLAGSNCGIFAVTPGGT